MNTEPNREEFREQITRAFDKTNPDAYSRNIIFSEIDDRYEGSTGRRTVMQSMFRVRKICAASLAVLVMSLMFGGTYSAVRKLGIGAVNQLGAGRDGNRDGGSEQSAYNNNSDGSNDNSSNNNNSSNSNSNSDNINNNGSNSNNNSSDGSNDSNNDSDSNNKDNSDKSNKDNDYKNMSDKDIIVKCLTGSCASRCYYKEESLNEPRDVRLAECIRNADLKPEIFYVTDEYEFIYVGCVAGNNISDRIFDKTERHTFAIFAQRCLKTDKKGNTDVGIWNADNTQWGYRFVCADTQYTIIDVAGMPVDEAGYIEFDMYYSDLRDDNMSKTIPYKLSIADLPGHDGDTLAGIKYNYKKKLDIYDHYHTLYELEREVFKQWGNPSLKAVKQYKLSAVDSMGLFNSKKHMVGEYKKYWEFFENEDYCSHNYDTLAYNNTLFRSKHPMRTKSDDGRIEYRIASRSFSKADMQEGLVSEKQISLYDRKCYYNLRDLEVNYAEDASAGDNINSITITVEGAVLCRVQNATESEETEYQKNAYYIGSMVKPDSVGVNYAVYLDYGKSIIIPFEAFDRIQEYGIYITKAPVEYGQFDNNKYDDGIRMLYEEKYWQADYLKDKVKIHVKVNMDNSSDEKTIVFGNNYYYDDNIMQKLGNTICGWE